MAMKSRPLGRKGVVVGDHVRVVGDMSGDDGSLARIVEVVPRTTTLRRTADDDDPVERVIVANADQLVVVTALADPEPRPRLIDRALVAAYDAGMAPLLCLTKADLADPETLLSTYRSLGVPWVVTQLRGEGAGDLTELRDRLRGRTSVLVGHSGVGKSTLVNALVPDAHREVGIVNAVTGRGRHTSTSAYLLELPATAAAGSSTPRASAPSGSRTWSPRTHRRLPRPRRDDRGLPARLHPRHRRARVRARRGGRRRRGRPRPGRVVPPAAGRAQRDRLVAGLAPDRPGAGVAGEEQHDQQGDRPTASSAMPGCRTGSPARPCPRRARRRRRAPRPRRSETTVAERHVAQQLARSWWSSTIGASSGRDASRSSPAARRHDRATAVTTASTTSGQRSSHRHLGTKAYASPVRAASGPRTTTAWTMSGWSGTPLSSMRAG